MIKKVFIIFAFVLIIFNMAQVQATTNLEDSEVPNEENISEPNEENIKKPGLLVYIYDKYGSVVDASVIIENEDRSINEKFITTETGIVALENLEPGTVLYVTVGAPMEYREDNNQYRCEIGPFDTKMENTYYSNSIELQRKKINLIINSNLENAEFEVSTPEGKGTYHIDENGEIKLDNIDAGYILVEPEQIDGYNKIEPERVFAVEEGQTYTIDAFYTPVVEETPEGGEDNPAGEKEETPEGGEDNPAGEKEEITEGGEDNPAGEKEEIPEGGEDNPAGEKEETPEGGEDNPAGEKEETPEGEQDTPPVSSNGQSTNTVEKDEDQNEQEKLPNDQESNQTDTKQEEDPKEDNNNPNNENNAQKEEENNNEEQNKEDENIQNSQEVKGDNNLKEEDKEKVESQGQEEKHNSSETEDLITNNEEDTAKEEIKDKKENTTNETNLEKLPKTGDNHFEIKVILFNSVIFIISIIIFNIKNRQTKRSAISEKL